MVGGTKWKWDWPRGHWEGPRREKMEGRLTQRKEDAHTQWIHCGKDTLKLAVKGYINISKEPPP